MPDQVERRVILSAREAAEGEGPWRPRLSDLHRPQATEPVLTKTTHCSHFDVIPDTPLWLTGLHPPLLLEPKQEVGSEPQKPGATPVSPRPSNPPPVRSLSRVLEPHPPSEPRELVRSCRTWRVSFPMVGVATGPWELGKGKGRGGRHAQGFDLFGPRVACGCLCASREQRGFDFFSPLLAAAAAAAILECGEGQGSLWTEGDN